jgi:NADH-quinone oxidoreductase B subunit
LVAVQKTGAFGVLVGKASEIFQDNVGAPVRYLVNWGRLYSMWPVHLETACCVTPDTVILGDNKPISEYQTGDSVVGFSGHVPVTQTFSREYQGDLIEITGRGMLPLRVTPEHPVLTVKRTLSSGKGTYSDVDVWKKAEDLICIPYVKVHGQHVYPSGSHDCVLIPRIRGSTDITVIALDGFSTPRGLNIVRGRGENPPMTFPLSIDTAWLLGIYVAEGWSTEGHDVYFSFNHDEDSIIRRVSRIVESLGYSPSTKVRETATVVRFSSSMLARALREWCGHLAENKRIPEFLLYHKNLELLSAFMRGYFEGDGSKIRDKRGPEHIRADTTSKILAQQVQLASARLGQFARITRGRRGGASKIMAREVKTNDAYTISVLTSKRRCSDFRVASNCIAVPIRRMVRVPYSGRVNNLETADNTYLVSNAVVHNCSVEVGAAGGARFDMERFGVLEAFGSLRQCDLLIVMGTVTRKLAPRLKFIYDQMPEPKWTIAMGACSITGGLYFDSYNVLRGIDDIIPVDVYVPGCPPRVEALLQGLILLQDKIRHSDSISGK